MDPLPPYWIRYQTESGVPYYFNQVTRKTQWEPPTVDGKTAAAAVNERTETSHTSRAVSLQARVGGASSSASTAVTSYGASGDSPKSGALSAVSDDTPGSVEVDSRSLEEGESRFASGASEVSSSSASWFSSLWCLDRASLRRLFEVESSNVKDRILEALAVRRGSESEDPLILRPDLYGPFWLAATISLLVFTCGCLPLLLERPGQERKSFSASEGSVLSGGVGVSLLCFASVAVYATIFLPVCAYWIVQTVKRGRAAIESRSVERETFLSLPQLLCLQGYAASPACVLVLLVSLAQVISSGVAATVLKSCFAATSFCVCLLFFLRQLRHVRLRRLAKQVLLALLLSGQACLLLVVIANAPEFRLSGVARPLRPVEVLEEEAPRQSLSDSSQEIPTFFKDATQPPLPSIAGPEPQSAPVQSQVALVQGKGEAELMAHGEEKETTPNEEDKAR